MISRRGRKEVVKGCSLKWETRYRQFNGTTRSCKIKAPNLKIPSRSPSVSAWSIRTKIERKPLRWLRGPWSRTNPMLCPRLSTTTAITLTASGRIRPGKRPISFLLTAARKFSLWDRRGWERMSRRTLKHYKRVNLYKARVLKMIWIWLSTKSWM